VFSPYYAWSRKRGHGDPHAFCSINVALYGTGGKRWAMTERSSAAVTQTAETFRVGPSALHWDGRTLAVDIDEVTSPIPSRIRGQIHLTPRGLNDKVIALDTEGHHKWWPIAPVADVEVALDKPYRHWRGHGYLDSNWGAVPLEQSFTTWHWSRADLSDGAAILYDVNRRNDDPLAVALRFDENNKAYVFDAPAIRPLPKTGWRIHRETRSETDHATVLATFEDTPFYARSMIETQLLGETVTAMHESLDMDRFIHPTTQFMLPFKMPRRRA
jgi:carotenoid 1,2-hydratase